MTRSALRLPLAAAGFIALADTAIVALALPPILRELDTDVAGVAGVLGVYAVVLAVSLPVAEAARGRLGTRACGSAGVLLFALGCLVCGLAESLGLLLAARALQAGGGAAVLVTAYDLLAREVAGARAWRLAALLGFAAGPALGGALTQAFGWRSIFLLQAPAALAALPAVLAAGPAPPAGPVAAQGRWPLGPVAALALASGAVAAALFLTVLLLIAGWGIDPLAAAAAVSVMPLAALVVSRVEGAPAVRAAGGCLLLAAGAASLAFLPTASVAWTLVPQLVIGVGMGLALPALAGAILPERNGRDAARLLSIRHTGIALALMLLAPIAEHELDATLAETREQGAALVLDAPLDPGLKLSLAPELAEGVQTEDPRAGIERVFAANRAEVDSEQRPAYRELAARADEVLVAGVNRGFAPALLAGAGLALLAALALAPPAAVRRPALAAGLAAAAFLGTAGFALAADRARADPVEIADPCQDRDLPGSGGLGGLAQDAALIALDRIACKAGSSREELVLALLDEESADRYEARYGVNPRSALDLGGLVLPG